MLTELILAVDYIYSVASPRGGGGVLRYISDGDV